MSATQSGDADSSIRQRILVVGCPRSGTTLLQSVLAAHPLVTSFTESHFFSDHFRPLLFWPWALQVRDVELRVRSFRTENAADPGDGDVDGTLASESGRRAGGRRLALPGAAARRLIRELDQLATARGAEVWLEKTPRHLRHLDWLERLLAQELTDHSARLDFVHVVRRGPAVVRSLERASRSWSHPYTRQQCIERWNDDLVVTLRRSRACALHRGPRRDHVVFFEDLVGDPDPTVEALCSALGLPVVPALTSRVAEVAPSLVLPEERWKGGLDRPLGAPAREDTAAAAALSAEETPGLRRLLYERVREVVA